MYFAMGWSHMLWFSPALHYISLDTFRQSSTVIYWVALVRKSFISLFLSLFILSPSLFLHPYFILQACLSVVLASRYFSWSLCEGLWDVEGYGSPVRWLGTSQLCHPQSVNPYLSSSAWYSSDWAGARFWSSEMHCFLSTCRGLSWCCINFLKGRNE